MRESWQRRDPRRNKYGSLPLESFETVVKLIRATKTAKGLKVRAVLDHSKYPTGVVPTKREMRAINIQKSPWHGDWNYAIRPQAS